MAICCGGGVRARAAWRRRRAGGWPNRASAAASAARPSVPGGDRGREPVQASHAVYYGFSTLDWQAAGFDGGAIGALWALGVLAEIALFALSGRLPALTPLALMLIGAAGALRALERHGVRSARRRCCRCCNVCTDSRLARRILARSPSSRALRRPELAATAQGYFAVALGATMAAATGLSGVLYGRFGSAAYAAMALSAAAGGLAVRLAAAGTRSSGTLRDSRAGSAHASPRSEPSVEFGGTGKSDTSPSSSGPESTISCVRPPRPLIHVFTFFG